MTKKLTLLVDGENLLKNSFHAGSSSYVSEEFLGATKLFLESIRKVIMQYSCSKVIIAWDGENSGKLRYDIYRAYKANRKGKDYYNQIELSSKQIYREENQSKSILKERNRVRQYAEELFFRQVIDLQTEADDIIGFYCTNLKEENEEVIIWSNDRDFCQLLTDDVSLYLPNKRVVVTPKNFYLFFDHHPDNSLLVKTIEGDKSDNIFGIDGVKLGTLLKFFPEIKTRKVTLNEVLDKAKLLLSEKKYSKHKSLNNLVNGTNFGQLKGMELYEMNEKLMDLHKPFITDEAIELLKDCKNLPLDDTDRGAKNVLKFMMEDGLINVIVGGAGKFAEWLQPFLFVVKEEKKFLENYNKK